MGGDYVTLVGWALRSAKGLGGAWPRLPASSRPEASRETREVERVEPTRPRPCTLQLVVGQPEAAMIGWLYSHSGSEPSPRRWRLDVPSLSLRTKEVGA